MASEIPPPDLDAVQETESEPRDSIRRVRKLLYRRLKIAVSDGRIFTGRLHCLDKHGNIILYDTTVLRKVPNGKFSVSSSSSSSRVQESEGKSGNSQSSNSFMDQRGLGLVLIPSKHRVSCEMEVYPDEELAILMGIEKIF